jgi:predicted nucleic acid-binding Zn ribbon protein
LDDARSDTASKTHNQRRNGLAIDDCNEVIALLRSGARIMEYFQNGEYSAPRTIDELERLAHTFDQLGFDFPSYKYQLKSYGFFKDSRALLQTEQVFMEVIRKLDKSIGFEEKLSSIPIIGCLIRLLSLEAPKLQRELRENTEAKKEFGVDELGERIKRTAENLFYDAKKIKQCGSQVTMLSSLTYSQLRAKDCSSKARSLRTKTSVVFQGAGAGTDFWVSMYRRANENNHVVELCIGDQTQSTVHCINAELDQAFVRIVNDWRNLGTGVLFDGGGDRRTLGSVMLQS